MKENIYSEKEIKQRAKKRRENPDGWKKKYPGLTEEPLSCPPIGSRSCTLPWRWCDSQYNKQQKKETKHN